MNTKTIETRCQFCKESRTLIVPLDGYSRWQAGELIQRVMYKLTAEERELLISGTCSKCWFKLFASYDGEN